MDTPALIVNLKTYEHGSGKDAETVAAACRRVADETGAAIAVAPQNADVDRVSDAVDIPVLAQHVDPAAYGSNTGSDLAETLAFNGASGVLINHSEDQVPVDVVEACVNRAHEAGLETIVCAESPVMAETVSAFWPGFVAFEPPELIGGDVSVASAQPGLVEEAVERSDVPVLTGAGVKGQEDVEKAVELGTEGVLVASGVVKAAEPEEAVRELVAGFDA
ncbi:MAG: triose-phosphate isomerase [Candidatus Nanohaloarchaea archaeon]|nr:triose-phosphate isomerase [Candidatus Nanohaloarchaea archaeon]